jgi:hypothetical protein
MAADPSAPGKPMGMFLQDPSLPELHTDVDFATTGDFLEGTGSSRFCVRDADVETEYPLFAALDWARADVSFKGFEAAGLVDNPQFHQVNAFAVLTGALALVEEELGAPIRWKEGGPLVVRPHAFEGFNAYYDPNSPSLNFGYATSRFRRTPVWTCLSHDVVAHEFGHAVLDNFRPLFLRGYEPDVGALHESIGDLLALFSALRHDALVRRLFEESGGDLRRPSVITRLAEEFGIGLKGGGFAFLRSSLDVLPYSDRAPAEPHARSLIWTGAVYELMVRLVERALGDDRSFERFVAAVVEGSRWVRGMLIRALHYLPPSGVTLPQLARLVWEADARVYPDDSAFRDIARTVFTERGLWPRDLDLTAPDIGAAFRPLEGADSAALARAVAEHARELGIPHGVGARLLTPDLVTSHRNVDKVTDEAGVSRLRPVVEHYLGFAYEIVVPLELDLPDVGRISFGLPLTFGGTLVLDEDWNAGLLVSHPAITAADLATEDPALSALARAVTRTVQLIIDSLGAAESPLALVTGDGVPRVVRRRCDLQEHLRGVAGTGSALFPFGPQPRQG